METTYMSIVMLITLILGTITKAFIEEIPSKYIPIQNFIIGAVSAFICYRCNIEPNLLQAIVLCIFAAMGAGGSYDLAKTIKGE